MSDLFRSAFNYISQAGPTILSTGGAVAGGRTDHPLVGSIVQVGDYKLNIRSLLAEGGYALVFTVQDLNGNWYALKRQLAVDREAATAILKEIQFLREVIFF